MPLETYGAVLGFAEAMEAEDQAFFAALAANPACGAAAQDYHERERRSRKNVQLIQRVRRENVTEMILEPITGLRRGDYATPPGDPQGRDAQAARRAVQARERRAGTFYRDAAAKLAALPEVARALKRLAHSRTES
jgi:hypothetical protein